MSHNNNQDNQNPAVETGSDGSIESSRLPLAPPPPCKSTRPLQPPAAPNQLRGPDSSYIGAVYSPYCTEGSKRPTKGEKGVKEERGVGAQATRAAGGSQQRGDDPSYLQAAYSHYPPELEMQPLAKGKRGGGASATVTTDGRASQQVSRVKLGLHSLTS